jgi:hypothetical protein
VEEETDEPESSLDEKEEEIDEPESSLDEKEEESDEQKGEEWISYPCQPSNESNSSSLTLFWREGVKCKDRPRIVLKPAHTSSSQILRNKQEKRPYGQVPRQLGCWVHP